MQWDLFELCKHDKAESTQICTGYNHFETNVREAQHVGAFSLRCEILVFDVRCRAPFTFLREFLLNLRIISKKITFPSG